MRKLHVFILLMIIIAIAIDVKAATVTKFEASKGIYKVYYSGDVKCKAFKLNNPDRFVVDLIGVSKCSLCDGRSYVNKIDGIEIRECWHKKDADGISKLYNDDVLRISFVDVDISDVKCKSGNGVVIVEYKKESKTKAQNEKGLNEIERISLRKFKTYEMVVVLLKKKPNFNFKKVNNVIYLTINNAYATKAAMLGQDLQRESEVVKSILALKTSEDSVRYVINLKNGAKVGRYYSDSRHVYIIFPIKAEENKVTSETKKQTVKQVTENNGQRNLKRKKILGMDRLISFDVRDAQLKDIFRVFAQISGLNFIIGDDVKGTLTMKLKDVPLDQALDLILQQEGLVAERKGNVVIVMTAQRYQNEKNQQLKALQDKEKLERMKNSITKVIDLNYVTPDYAVTMINKLLYNSKNNTGFIVSDVKNNAIICHDTPENIEKIEKIVKLIDQRKKAVEIDARIVEISKTFERQLGIQWGGTFENYYNAPGTTKTFIAAGNGNNLPANPFNPDLPAPGNDFIVNLPVTLSDAPMAANVGLLIGRADYNIDLKLTAGEIEGYTKIISSPKVITLDNMPAKIESGQEIPYQESAGASGATSISFKEATLSLDVTPHITNNDQIILKIKVNKDSADFSHAVNGEPPINTNTVETTIVVPNGQTVVLGGLVQKTNLKTESGVPGLMRIPLLGWLFKTKRYYNPESELFIFVTPKIVNERQEASYGW